MHNFQKIWVHIYVASLSISTIFKVSLTGFRESQNQNIAINPLAWQEPLPDFLYYNLPAQYELYYTDTTFFRNIYSIAVAFLILIVVYVVFYLIFRIKTISDDSIFRHFRITFVLRPFFYWNSVVFYQYFTLVLACCFQFMDLASRGNVAEGFIGVNAAAAIIAFIFATAYPIIHFFVLRKKKH